MVASRKRPKGAFRRSFGLILSASCMMPASVGYQDLAALIARQPARDRARAPARAQLRRSAPSMPRPSAFRGRSEPRSRRRPAISSQVSIRARSTSPARSIGGRDHIWSRPRRRRSISQVDRRLKGDLLVPRTRPQSTPDRRRQSRASRISPRRSRSRRGVRRRSPSRQRRQRSRRFAPAQGAQGRHRADRHRAGRARAAAASAGQAGASAARAGRRIAAPGAGCRSSRATCHCGDPKCRTGCRRPQSTPVESRRSSLPRDRRARARRKAPAVAEFASPKMTRRRQSHRRRTLRPIRQTSRSRTLPEATAPTGRRTRCQAAPRRSPTSVRTITTRPSRRAARTTPLCAWRSSISAPIRSARRAERHGRRARSRPC